MPVSSTRSLVLLIFILASHITDTLARHHHIKLRHERHRRQHGESYLPSSFVLDTDEEDSGNWGPWSIPSSCSRSCGGGVAHQTRRCHDVDVDGVESCSGAEKRFFSCNVQECPDPDRDFRAEQCAEFNNVPMEGVYYDWIPYTGAPNKCELNCMPRGQRFFHHHKSRVTDGTLCTNEQNDVCVEGKCRPVGCDMMLGSGAKEDRCRECGGDGSACNTVQGLLDMNDLQVGYNDILLIPAGATNIAIAEVRPSNNYLAIRNSTGHYYLNGNWRIDFPRSLKFVGSVFYYERRPKEFLAADMISALGPTTEALYIVLLYQDKNVGVKYEYSIPKKLSQPADPDSYTWVTEEYSECSATCGGGIQSRLVRCVRRRDMKEADPNLCDQQLEPDSTQACAEEACPPEWVIGNWGPCSKECAPGGEQSREIKCQRVISGDIPSLVDDHTCLELIGPKDIEIQECNKDVECPHWHIGPWKPCDHLCGEGKQTRKITCFKKVEGKVFALPDSACHEERPESEKDCELRPCAGVDWVVSKWSGCDDNCGLNLETRTTSCVTLEGKVYPDEKCNAETKPKLVRSCAAPDKCEYQWFAAQWSECSAKCGTGIQTRNVFCANMSPDTGTITKVDSGKCDPEKKYNDTKDCVAEVEECGGEWYAGPWSECSKPCGGGDMTRKVICMKGGQVVPIKGNCEQHSIMFSSEVCNVKACEDDEVLPVEPDKISSLGEGDEEECEDYEDDELVIIGPDKPLVDGADALPFASPWESSGNGEDDGMMGDDPWIHNESWSAFGSESDSEDDPDYPTDSTTDDYYSTLEGSGSTITTDWSDTDSTVTSSDSTQSENTSPENTQTTSENSGATEPAVSTTEFKDIFDNFRFEADIPKKKTTQKSHTTSTTESSYTSDSTASSDSDSSSSSTVENDETSESVSTSSSEGTSESTAISDLSSSDTSTETTVLSETKSDGTFSTDATASSSSDTTLSSSNPEATESTSSETSGSPSSDTTESSSFETTVSPGSESTGSETTKLSETEETGSSSSDTTVQSSSDATQSSSSEITRSTSSDTTVSSSSETTLLSGSESTESSSFETTVSSSSDTTVSGSSEPTESSGSTETTASGSSDSTGSSTSEFTGSSISENEVSGSSETTGSSGSTETTASGSSDSTGSSTSEFTGSSISETEVSGSSETTESSGSTDTTASGSSDSTGSSTSEFTGSSISETEVSGSSETTESSGSTDTTASGSSDSTGSSTSESTISSSSDTTVSGSSEPTESSTSESTGSSISETEVSGSSETTESSGSTETTVSESSDSTGSSTSESTGSSISETEVSGSSEPTESAGSTETTASGSSESTESSTPESTGSSISETEVSGSSESTGSSTSESTGSSISETEVSGSSETTELSGSTETTASGSPESTELSSSESTVSGSSETTESSGSTEATVFSSTETTVFSDTETTESTESSPSSETTISGSSSESSETTGSDTSTDTTVSGEVGASEASTESTEFTESTETSISGETELTTESGVTSEGTWETTESGLTTETDEDIDTTGQSHVSDIFTTLSPIDQAITKEHKRRKCKARKHKKTCKTSPFGCCYDGIKAATGPFGKGCPIPETCKETEYGCCPDDVSPATGPNNEGCPDSHCEETLFGCCPDNITPAEGNDFEGCPQPCNETEFGCCPDDKTPAAGQDYLGCCNTTEHGCCPDGIAPASGPNKEGCAEESTSPMTSTTTEEITTEISTSTTVEEGCANTEFGCCPEGKEPASGKDFAGCKEINNEKCTESYYGCCPDQTSAALGENNKGCHMPCENSAFGCCVDGVTPAHGPYYDGCCLSTPYGCCPDNIRSAQGPNFHGCGCEYATYGCCPDSITSARGPNNEGCRCEHTTHGCCPNRINPASGPDFEGCACHTYQFGCCPDGITVAKGPQEQGCGCESTEFRCCSDGKTPAEGPNYAGCTCDASKYGCCPDGVEEAQGENFEGCRTVPITPGAACTLEKDRGTCWDLTVKWYYDTEYGGCSRFWYGGCEGNENRFKSQEECKQVCVEPKGRDACFLPKISGPCEGYHPTWYYDSERKQCGQFIYSGCNGNANKFKTIEECEELCIVPDEIDGCDQPKEPGPCEGNFTRWYFNKESSRCEEFTYGGCKSNKNNFPTQIACQHQCLTPGRSRVQEVCALEKDPGPCPGSSLRWYYDSKRKSCRQFVYGGCKGNGNKFRTYAACEQRCPVRDSCSLQKEEGTCTEKYARWFFDQPENRCMPFYYTGCGGNKNNYETKDACDSDCPPKIEQDICLLPAIVGDCHNWTQRWYYDAYEKQCRQFYYGSCGGNGNNFQTEYDCMHRCADLPATEPTPVEKFRREFCFQPEDNRICTEQSNQWFYDAGQGICRQFRYGGCSSSGNKFSTEEECEYRCGNVQDLCDLPPTSGSCGKATRRFYYDRSRDSCLEFDYGGCRGNKNNFEDRNSCEQRCKVTNDTAIAVTLAALPATLTTLTTPKPRDRIPAVSPTCSAPLDAGNCDADITAYWYNAEDRVCQAFIYGGCDGNANRFQTEEQCERLCGNFVGQDVCNLRVDTGPCRGAFPKYYYDYVTRTCREFIYGGCDGNANRFSTISECESICIHREEPPVSGNGTAISNLATCREPVDVGSCSTGSYIRFYYDDDRLTCIAFIYTGCGGNRNRFKNFNSCIKTCSPTTNEVDVGPELDSKDPCRDARVECETIRCPYGKEEYVDSEDCQRCRCADPCRTERCPEGTRCAITLVAERGTNIYKGICRETTKPGNCPSVLNSTTCEEECSSDADCPEDYKCCSNGCGSSCLQPAPTEPITTTPEPVTVPDDGYEPARVKEPENPRPRAPEGGYVILECVTSGNPRPIISWRKGVSLIDSSFNRYSIGPDGALQIVGLYRSDAGIYTCTATNRLAAPVRIQYVLEITAPVEHPPAILGAVDYRVTVTLNSPTVLQCYAYGWPRPLVNWWHGDKMLPITDSTREHQRDYSLQIHKVSLTNLGVYTCQAYNALDKPASWSVTVQAPGPVYNISPENQKYARYLIPPPSRPGPTNRPVQRPRVPETQTYAPYPNERPDKFTAKPVTNHEIVIPGRFRVPLKVTVPEAKEPYPVGSEFTIPCNVDSYLKPTVVWYKDDNPLQTNDRIRISDANRLTISNAEKTDSGTYRCEASDQDSTASGSVDITVDGIYIHPSCQDNLFLAKCDLIVKAKYCQHTYYAKFCCRSCTEAGQLPPREPHINDTRRRRRSPSFLSLF